MGRGDDFEGQKEIRKRQVMQHTHNLMWREGRETMISLMVSLRDRLSCLRDQRGIETLEWILIGGVVAGVAAGVYATLEGGLNGAVTAITTYISAQVP